LWVRLSASLDSLDEPVAVFRDQVFKWSGSKGGFHGVVVRGSENLKDKFPAEFGLGTAKAVHFLERPKLVLPFALTKYILFVAQDFASVVLNPGSDQLSALVRGHDG
jgi:hypothetical protein